MDLKTRAQKIAERARHGRNHDTVLAQRRQIRRLRRKIAAQQQRVQELKARAHGRYEDVDSELLEIYQAVRPYTMTGREKVIALITAVRHIARAGIPGDIVECGVWRGGSVHAVARTLAAEGVTDREIHLFDTFEGMTEPTDKDRRTDGKAAAEMLAVADRTQWVWAVASLEDVEEGLRTLPYPYDRFHLVQGPVEETIPERAPQQIALLRLDTDWYESTKHELEHLYDRLVPGGVLIIDDYGTWQGSKEATDEFLSTLEKPPLMHRAGRARIGVKP